MPNPVVVRFDDECAARAVLNAAKFGRICIDAIRVGPPPAGALDQGLAALSAALGEKDAFTDAFEALGVSA